MRYLNFLLIITFFSTFFVTASAKLPFECGKLKNHYGPYDFTNPTHRAENWPIVTVHFTPNVENLIKGNIGHLTHDLDYTLRAFPNQHRALYSVIKYELQNRDRKLIRTAECYLLRATEFQPKDETSWLLFGIYYHKKGEYQKALEKYNHSLKLTPENSQLHYNLGLLYYQIEDFDKSLYHAKKAYKQGAKLPALKRKLLKAGIWK